MIDTAQVEKEHQKGISVLTGEDATPEREKPFQFVGEGFEVLGNHADEAAGVLRPANTVGVEPNRSLRQQLAEKWRRMKSHGSNTDRI
jgi:hypothetical protein